MVQLSVNCPCSHFLAATFFLGKTATLCDGAVQPIAAVQSEYSIWTRDPEPDVLNQIAQRKNATPAQIALAWLLAQKPWIVPIPGTTKIQRLAENIGSASLELTPGDLDEINAAASKIPIQGQRLPESILRMSYR